VLFEEFDALGLEVVSNLHVVGVEVEVSVLDMSDMLEGEV
jgi:hypothetical protein